MMPDAKRVCHVNFENPRFLKKIPINSKIKFEINQKNLSCSHRLYCVQNLFGFKRFKSPSFMFK
jgi:hypothetical protein